MISGEAVAKTLACAGPGVRPGATVGVKMISGPGAVKMISGPGTAAVKIISGKAKALACAPPACLRAAQAMALA